MGDDNGRFSVLADGTLVIERVVTGDAGEYVCEAQSPAGSAFAKAKLNVRGEEYRDQSGLARRGRSPKLPISRRNLGPYFVLSSLGPPESTTQMASRSVPSFLF